ncbi:MAG TPA: LytTR family DNA-binding domain-containing protein [Pyrinomonadaceae bacterium]|nr:LytTR family DNA-binding domain-containing protein [Pyrinomonadaceae bacterium]
MRIKTVIIDDEVLARRRIAQLLSGEPEFEIVGEGESVAEAVRVCSGAEVDLIFLDVQLPDGSGFDVLRDLPHDRLPAVIFVTAYDQYTIEAFDFHAVDYLLKPFSKERFGQSTERIRSRLDGHSKIEISREVSDTLDLVSSDLKYLVRVTVNHGGRLIVLPVTEIDWVAAFGNYLRVHSKGKTYLLRGTINRMEERLDPDNFVRIHRSTIVRIDSIKEFQPHFGGQYVVVLKDGTKFILSRNYRKQVLGRFEA